MHDVHHHRRMLRWSPAGKYKYRISYGGHCGSCGCIAQSQYRVFPPGQCCIQKQDESLVPQSVAGHLLLVTHSEATLSRLYPRGTSPARFSLLLTSRTPPTTNNAKVTPSRTSNRVRFLFLIYIPSTKTKLNPMFL